MNKNSKAARNALKKAKTEITVTRMRTAAGQTKLNVQTFVIPFGHQARKSQPLHGKVAAKRSRTKNQDEE